MPNIVKYRDEWSRKKSKNSGVSQEQLRSKETDTDTEEDKNKTYYLDSVPAPEAGVGGGHAQHSLLSPPEAHSQKPGGKEGKSKGRHKYEPDYEAFYTAYPRKVSKQDGERVWLALKAEGKLAPLPDMMRSLSEYARHHKWTDREAKHIPHISTFLNQERFTEHASTLDSEEREWIDRQMSIVDASLAEMARRDREYEERREREKDLPKTQIKIIQA